MIKYILDSLEEGLTTLRHKDYSKKSDYSKFKEYHLKYDDRRAFQKAFGDFDSVDAYRMDYPDANSYGILVFNKNNTKAGQYAFYSNSKIKGGLTYISGKDRGDIQAKVSKTFDMLAEYALKDIERKHANKEAASNHTVKVGDIFTRSFGYSMSLVNYYQVVSLVGTKSCKVRRIKSKRVGDEDRGGGYYVVPLKDEFYDDKIITSRIQSRSNKFYITIDSDSADLYIDGEKDYVNRND